MDFMLEWQQNLRLGDWNINLHIHEGDHVHPSQNSGCPFGEVEHDYDNLSADIHIALEPSRGGEEYSSEEIIIHELIHLVLTELRETHRTHVLPRLSKDAKNVWISARRTAEERVVNRLTMAMSEYIETDRKDG